MRIVGSSGNGGEDSHESGMEFMGTFARSQSLALAMSRKYREMRGRFAFGKPVFQTGNHDFQTGKALFQTGNHDCQTEKALFQTGNHVFQTGKVLCKTGKALCKPDKALCKTDKALCKTDKALCKTGKVLFQTGERLLKTGKAGRTPEKKVSKSAASFSKSENAAAELKNRLSRQKNEEFPRSQAPARGAPVSAKLRFVKARGDVWRREPPTKQGFADKGVPKLELRHEGKKSVLSTLGTLGAFFQILSS